MKILRILLLSAVFCILLAQAGLVQSDTARAYDLIAAVNALRVSNGLNELQVDGALMAAAQGQADHLASIAPNVGDGHAGPGGNRPIDRAAAAGYALGAGWNVVENWAAARASSPISDIIYGSWSDGVHWNTMTSADGVHVGAGAAEASNGLVYYILDVGVQYGSGGVPQTPRSGIAATVPTAAVTARIAPLKLATPAADGSIVHEVQTGQALWNIAMAYEVSVDDLIVLNDLPANPVIYTGQKILVKVAFTPTPEPTATLTPRPPTRTPIPQQTAQELRATSVPDERDTSLNLDRRSMGIALVLICGIGLALLVVGTLSKKKNSKPEKPPQDPSELPPEDLFRTD